MRELASGFVTPAQDGEPTGGLPNLVSIELTLWRNLDQSECEKFYLNTDQ